MSDAGNWTVLRLINWTMDYFARVHMENPRLSGELLLAHVLGCPRMALYTQFDRVVVPPQLDAFRDLVRQAHDGWPVAYLVGRREFYSLTFKVNQDVLVPRPETELLVEAVLDFVKAAGGAGRLWDVCTGCGCVGISAAHYAPALTVLVTDISEPALAVARENAAAHGVQARVRIALADLLTLPESARDLAPFDAITANPPYIADDQVQHLLKSVRMEPDVAVRSGKTGLEHTARIVQQAPAHLRPGGLLALETGMGMADAVYDLLKDAGAYEDIRLRKDAAGIERAVLALRQ